MSMQGSAMMYVTSASLASLRDPPRRSPLRDSVSSATSSGARSTSADFTITWSNPAVCARCSPALSVWFVKPTIGTSGHASTTSTGSTRAMSTITRSGASMLSLVTKWWPGSRASSFPRKKRSTPTSRIVDTRTTLAPRTDTPRWGSSRGSNSFAPGRTSRRTRLEDEWREAPAERDFLQGLVHVAVAWHHAGRGNRPGCERQLEGGPAACPLPAAHRGVDVDRALAGSRAPRRSSGRARSPSRRPTSDRSVASERRLEPEPLEEAVQVDAEDVEALEEEQQAERDEHRASDHLDRPVVVPQPAERPHRAREDRSREHEGDGKPERVDGEEEGALGDRVGRPREDEGRGEDRADAGRGADGERTSEQERDPRSRAPSSRPAPRSRSGQGRRPVSASPKTTSTKPAIRSRRNWSERSRPPTRAAPVPRSTKNAVKPSTKGTLATTTRRAFPGWPSLSASTADTADRYPGTSGSTHGARNESSPARNETGMAVGLTSGLEASELLVDPALELGVERHLRRSRRAPPAPGPDEHGDHDGPADERREEGARRGPNPRLPGVARTPGPNSSTSASLISCSESPAAIRSRM